MSWNAAALEEAQLIYATGRDVTRRRETEEAERRGLLLERVRRAVLEMEQVEDFERVILTLARQSEEIGLDFEMVGVNVIDEEEGHFHSYGARSGAAECVQSLDSIQGVASIEELARHWRTGEAWVREPEELLIPDQPDYRPALVIDVSFAEGTLAADLPGLIELLRQMAPLISLDYWRARDIEGRRQAEASLIRSAMEAETNSRLYRAVVDNIIDAAVTLNE